MIQRHAALVLPIVWVGLEQLLIDSQAAQEQLTARFRIFFGAAFTQLQTDITGSSHDSLGQAIQALRPKLSQASVKNNVKLARAQAPALSAVGRSIDASSLFLI